MNILVFLMVIIILFSISILLVAFAFSEKEFIATNFAFSENKDSVEITFTKEAFFKRNNKERKETFVKSSKYGNWRSTTTGKIPYGLLSDLDAEVFLEEFNANK